MGRLKAGGPFDSIESLETYFLPRRLRRIIMPPDSSAKAAAPVVASISGAVTAPANTDPPMLKNTRAIPITFLIFLRTMNSWELNL